LTRELAEEVLAGGCEGVEPGLRLLVPARLHGLDWAGDPYASVPCARRAAEEIARILEAAHLPLDSVEVGDPDPVAAIIDALSDQPADRLIVLERRRRLGAHVLDLAHRVRRVTGLPVLKFVVPEPTAVTRHQPLAGLWDGRCSFSASTRTAALTAR
jgi:hypothetical protein